MNYYELLEISPSASIEVIRNAYKTLAKKYHPDTYKGDNSFAEEKMKLLNEAISVLEDEGKRSEYNKINGINSRYGKNNMLNFDENGESIFFTYDIDADDTDNIEDSDISGMPGNGGDSYMDIIDSFINNNKPEEKSKKKPKRKKERTASEEDDIDNIDIVQDISAINDENPAGPEDYGYGNIDDFDDIRNLDNLDNLDNIDDFDNLNESDPEDPDFKTFDVSRGKAKNKTKMDGNKIYVVVLALLITGIVFFGAMIIRVVDLDNIKNLFSGIKEKPTDANEAGNFGLTDEDDITENPDDSAEQPTTLDVEFIIPTESEETTDENGLEDTTENEELPQPPITDAPTDPPPVPTVPPPTAPPETKPPETEPPATDESTTPEPVTEPETDAPTTEEPTTEAPTEAPTEPATEEPTEAPTPEITEPPTEPEPETEPETIIPPDAFEPIDPDDLGANEEE